MAVMFIGSFASASEVVIDEDFSGDLSGWTTSTSGNPIDYTDAAIEAGELRLRANSGSGNSSIYARNNTAFDATSSVVTQSFTVGGTQDGLPNLYPDFNIWLTDATFQNGIRIRLREFGGYARLLGYSYVNGVETYLGDRQYIADIASDGGSRFAGDIVTVEYDTTDILSLTFYDASLDTTNIIPKIGSTHFALGEVNHGVNFATAFAGGAYTGLSQTVGVWMTLTARIDSVTTSATAIPEPATMALLGIGALVAVVRKKR